MDFRILGPLEVTDQGREPAIAASKQRALLAILLLHANEVVSSDRLIEELWGERPPASAPKSLQVYISRLRHALESAQGNGADSVIVTRGGGYLIRVGPGELDLDRFERLLEEGSGALADGDPARALDRLRDALALWRGQPLEEFAYEQFAQSEIARLEELHLTGIELRIEAELALGRHAQLIGELETLVERHPFRERLRAQMMLALYRSGRQAEALESYQAARRTLVDELGIEPSRELEELQRAILAHEPSLDQPRGSSRDIAARDDDTHVPELPPGGASTPRRPRALVATGLVVAALALAGVVLVITGDRDEHPGVEPLTDDSQAVAVIDPGTDEVVQLISVGTRPGPLAYDRRSHALWVANLDDETVTQVDTRRGRPRRTVAVGNIPDGLAAADGSLWVAGHAHGVGTVNVRKIDGRFFTRDWTSRIPAGPPQATDLALAGNQLWVAPSFGLLTRVDATTGSVQRAIDTDHKPSVVAATTEAVWVADGDLNRVTRVDAATGSLTSIPVGNGPAGIALGEQGAWVTLRADDSVVRINPKTGSVTKTIPVGRGPVGVAVGAGAVWVANADEGTVSKIDPRTEEVVATIRIGASPQDIVVGDDRVWVSVQASPRPPASTGGTAEIEFADDPGPLDPALGYSTDLWMIGYATGAKLLNYPDAEGPAGLRLVPEVAESLPRRSPDGRTYTFKIRRGFRFSPPSNEPVTADTFKYTIERALSPRMHGVGPQFLRDVIGADAYASGRAKHIAGITARGDTLTFRLSRASGDFTSRIATPFFAAVPTDTPREAVNTVSSAGPYYRASYLRDTIVLRRNPNYHGPRPRPLREIRITVDVGEKLASKGVASGTADWASPSVSAADAPRLARRFGPASRAAEAGGQRYFVNPTNGLLYLTMNTKRDLFSTTRMRRAVNYAIDRRALARQGGSGGSSGATPTDQYLPPGMPGFRDAQIYPLQPNLTEARRLAGPGRRTAVLYSLPDPGDRKRAEIVKANLSAIGIDVQVKIFPDAVLFRRLARTGEPYDLALARWYPDYADPVTFLGSFDPRPGTGNPNRSINNFEDPAYTTRLAAAERLSAPARYLAYGRLESDLARHAAPWAAFAYPVAQDFFSARIGCQTFHPIYGMDLAALCLRK